MPSGTATLGGDSAREAEKWCSVARLEFTPLRVLRTY
jgi:hypothetical protein